jgi:lipid II:glycine glycyltransferase (peptidoglycan interpeptide bridge formation enzyme)
MQDTDRTFSYTLRTRTQTEWQGILDRFQDASVFQTIAFCAAKSSRIALEHFVLNEGSEVVAAAQVRLIRAPLLGSCIAYVLWGPLCQLQQRERDLGVLREAVRALRHEYVVRRGLGLRINPQFAPNEGPDYVALFRDEGYTHVKSRGGSGSRRTILIDLRPPLQELRKGLDQKWRNQLNRAEKNALELVEGNDDARFDMFLRMYRQMLSRKRLAEPGDIRAFMAMQQMLPPKHRMNVIVALENGEPCAGAICSAIGGRGIYLFGATADAGLKNKASYLVQWRIIQWLKDMNCVEYDLHGVNAEENPGVYLFKTGLCGKNGEEVELLGSFDAYRGLTSNLVLRVADVATLQRDRLKNIYGKYRGFKG